MGLTFHYEVDQCDVRPSERARLEQYRERLSMWHQWLSADENSIWNQIHTMLWSHMVFLTINEARRVAKQNPTHNVGFNRATSRFIDYSYVASQLLAIRRLTDANKRRDAISLPRLIDDLKEHADLFTREIYVCFDGLPFDPEPAMERFVRAQIATAEHGDEPGETGVPTSGPEAFGSAERAHQSFDRLIGASGQPRSRDDRIDPKLFDNIKSKLGFSDSINKLTSKYLVHPGDSGSRQELTEGNRHITIDRIVQCQRILSQLTAYIDTNILWFGSRGLIPTPQHDHLEHLDKPFVATEHLPKLHEFWKERTDEIEEWVGQDSMKKLQLPL